MAEPAPEAPDPTATPRTPRREGGRGRGRGGPGSGQNHTDSARGGDDGSRGRGRRRGRGAGDRTRGGRQFQSDQDHTSTNLPQQPEGRGGFGARLTKAAADASIQGESRDTAATAAGGDDDSEAEVCFICASPVAHSSVAPCNHRTCHICSLRLRALYKTKACAHCRTESATVIFTDDPEKRFEEYLPEDFVRKDSNLGINYEKQDIFEDTVLLLRYNCPDPSCDVACMGWPDLHRHVRSAHNKVMCDLCTRNKKVFTHEHELFTQAELKKHERYGDDNPGAVDQSGFKGHPECGFCRQRFYGDDELYAHCRDRHERCHLCDRRTNSNTPRYFVNYDALEQHFTKEHFPCQDKECQEQKFVVFDSEMDLKAHQIEKHPNGLTKGRDARRIDISSFDYRQQYQPERGGRGGRRPARGRDPNAEPMPATSAPHMSRAEIAYQRQREIQSAQSVSTRSFGGQLTQPNPAPRQSSPRLPQSPRLDNAQPAVNSTDAEPSLESLPPAERARRLRHAAVTERAASLLRQDKLKLDEFRERISSYRSDKISAPELIDAFFSLFDTSSSELGKLVKELADIFEISAKRDMLIKAWNDWKAINEDYPSLPGPTEANATSAVGGLGAKLGSSRVLKLKSSTVQSGRSAASNQAAWSSAAASGSANRSHAGSSYASATPFPSLPSANGGNKAASSGWLALRPAVPAATPSSRPVTASNRVQPRQAVPNADSFPALPAAKKPTSTVFSPGYVGPGVIRSSGSATPVNAWAAGSSNGAPAAEVQEQLEDVAAGGKGKKGKKKQIVFAWG